MTGQAALETSESGGKEADKPVGSLKSRFRIPSEVYYFGVYAALTVLFTYPVAFRITGTFYGLPEDPYMFQWFFWYLARKGGWVLGFVPTVGYPLGINLEFIPREMGVFFPGKILTWLFGETAAYNILILGSFFLAGVFMYYLVRHLTGSKSASFLAGLAFAFCPYHLAHAQVHVNLAGIHWIPMFFLCLYLFIEKRTWPRAAFTGITFALVMLSDYHYGLFAAILTAIILTVELVSAWRGHRLVRPSASTVAQTVLALAVVALLVAPFALTLVSNADSLKGRSSTSEVIRFSARPWDYVLPPADNPVLGKLTSGFITSHLHNAEVYETTNYIGIVVAAMAIAGLVFAFGRKGRRRRKLEESETPAEDAHRYRVMVSMVIGASVFFLLSLPPQFHLGNTKIYLPSVILQKVLPLMRSYSRFGMMVFFCVLVMASYGITTIFRRKAIASRQLLAVAILGLLILLDFTVVPPFRYMETKPVEPLYTYLAGQEFDGGIAYYPMDNHGWYAVSYLFWQRVVDKPMLNGGNLIGAIQKQYQYLMDVLHPDTPGILAALGIKKAVVDYSQWQKAASANDVDETPVFFPSSLLPDGYRVEKELENGLVLDVAANPSVFVPSVEYGLSWPQMISGGRYTQWCESSAGIDIENRSRDDRYVSLALDTIVPSGLTRLGLYLNGSPVGAWNLFEGARRVEIKRVRLMPGDNKLQLVVDNPGGEAGEYALGISPLYINE